MKKRIVSLIIVVAIVISFTILLSDDESSTIKQIKLNLSALNFKIDSIDAVRGSCFFVPNSEGAFTAFQDNFPNYNAVRLNILETFFTGTTSFEQYKSVYSTPSIKKILIDILQKIENPIFIIGKTPK